MKHAWHLSLLSLVAALLLVSGNLAAQAPEPQTLDPTGAPAPDSVDPESATTTDPESGEEADEVDPESGEEADQLDPSTGDAPDTLTPETGETGALEPTTPGDIVNLGLEAASTTLPTSEPTEIEVVIEEEEVVDPERLIGIPNRLPTELAPPQNVHAVDRPVDYLGSVTVDWERSADHTTYDGAVESYLVEYRVGDAEWGPFGDPLARSLPMRALVEDVELDQEVWVRVTAQSYTVGDQQIQSEPVEAGPFTVRRLPAAIAAPTNLRLKETPGDFDGTITVEWDASADDGAGLNAVAGYVVTTRSEGEEDWAVAGDVIGTEFVFLEPDPEAQYEFQVAAFTNEQAGANLESDGVIAGPFQVRSLPDTIAAPASVRYAVSADDLAGSLGITWDLSADDGQGTQSVSHYRLEVSTDGGDFEYRLDLPAGTASTVGASAEFGKSYQIRVRAISFSDPHQTDWFLRVFGDDPTEATRVVSDWTVSEPVERRAFPAAIAPVTELTATDVPDDLGGSVQLSWTPSADDGGGENTVARYQVEYKVGESEEWVRTEEEASAGASGTVWSGMTSGESYTFRVRAASAAIHSTAYSLTPGYLASGWVESSAVESQAELLTAEATNNPPAASGVTAADISWDGGGSATVTWEPVDDIASGTFLINEFHILTSDSPDGFFTEVLTVEAGATEATVPGLDPESTLYVRVLARSPAGVSISDASGSFTPTIDWFNGKKVWAFFIGILLCGFVLFFIRHARKGKKLFIRKMSGLDAVDEAIGRATEMGRPILFVPGIMDLDNVQTLAGLTILGHTAKTVAEYDTKLDVPVSRSLVLTAGREIIKQSYLEAGRPDAYNENMVHYLTDAQFGYVAGVNGIIVRDEPATCFYMGAFYAESLILAETGNAAGAIQIAGTAMPSQLPFFVAACDYTLIGEELFAASAYLSQDPKQLGSLKGQDIGKLIAMISIFLGALAATIGLDSVVEFLHGVFG